MNSNLQQLKKQLTKMEIILFGAGNYAKAFYRDFSEQLNIKYCISNDKNEEIFCIDGQEICPVLRVDSVNLTDRQMIILCAESFQEMEVQLRDMGYRNGVDYLNSNIVRLLLSNKKLALFYGVCYMRAIYNCIIKSKKFCEKYEAFYWLDYRKMEPQEYEFFSFLLPLCDLFLYNVFVSFDKLQRSQAYLHRLSKECRIIRVPLITFNGYHPRTEGTTGEENPYQITSIKTYYGTFMVPDCNVNRLILEGKSCSEIVKILGDIDFYSKSWLEENFQKEIKKLRLAERLADIKFVDFLLEKHKKERLFLNETHISNLVIIELAKKVLDFIAFENKLPEEWLKKEQLLYTTEIPIYPSVIEHLDLEIYKNNPKYRLFTFENEIDMSFEEYLERYYEYCICTKRWIEEGYYPR